MLAAAARELQRTGLIFAVDRSTGAMLGARDCGSNGQCDSAQWD
jgi:hypothetical protein